MSKQEKFEINKEKCWKIGMFYAKHEQEDRTAFGM